MVGDQSQPNKRPTKKEEKKQKKSKKDVYISVLFSIMPYEMMTTYKHSKYTIDGKNYESVWMVKPSKSVWKKGKFNKNKINKSLFIDCSELVINIDTGEVDDDEELMELMDHTMVKIHSIIEGFKGKYKKYSGLNLHFILGSDTECQDMLYATNFVCDNSMSDKIKDSSFQSFLSKKYSSYFSQYTNIGWKVKVDYCGAYEIKIIHAPMMPSQEKGGSSKANDNSKTHTQDNQGQNKTQNNKKLQLLDVDDADIEAFKAEHPSAKPQAETTTSKPENTDKKDKQKLELLDVDYEQIKTELGNQSKQ